MGLRYLRVDPGERTAQWVELETREMHDPPVYLARLRLHRDREPALDLEHVRDVARPVLERLGCRDTADYVARAALLARARARVTLLAAARPERDEHDGVRYELARDVVAGTLDPRERAVYRVHDSGEHALTFWLPDQGGTPELAWVSRRFRADERLRTRAVEHGFSYVGWALGELAPERVGLLESPRPLILGWSTLPTI